MAFWDASAAVMLCVDQRASGVVRRWVRASRSVVVWWGTPVEIRSALARLERERALSASDHDRCVARLDAARLRWSEIVPSEELRASAEGIPREHRLRAADALQLAAALVWSRGRPRGRPFACVDARLAEAAADAGFDVWTMY